MRKSIERQLSRRGYKSERAGRSATMHVVIERWARVADGSGGGTACVELSARLYDDATGTLIWEGHGRSGCETDLSLESHGSWWDRQVELWFDQLFDWIVGWFADEFESAGEDAVRTLIRSLPRAAGVATTTQTPEQVAASAQ